MLISEEGHRLGMGCGEWYISDAGRVEMQEDAKRTVQINRESEHAQI